MKPTILLAPLLAALLAAAAAPAAEVTTGAALMEEARRYAETTTRPSFRNFVQRYGRSVQLEALMWELTVRPDTLAELEEIFGRSDPWYYRREATPSYGRGGRD